MNSLRYKLYQKRKEWAVKFYHRTHRYTELYQDDLANIRFYGRQGDFRSPTVEISIVSNYLGDFSIKQVFTTPSILKVLKDFRDTKELKPAHTIKPDDWVTYGKQYGTCIMHQKESAVFYIYYFADSLVDENLGIEAVEFTRLLTKNEKIHTIEKFTLPTQILSKWDE